MMIETFFKDHPVLDKAGKVISGGSLTAGMLEKFTLANVNDALLFIGLVATTTYSVLRVVGWFDERRERKRKLRQEEGGTEGGG